MDGNLEYYKVFYYVAKEKSLTKAAELLSISQPAGKTVPEDRKRRASDAGR